MRLSTATVLAILAASFGFASCGPAGLTMGVADLADNDAGDRTFFVLVLVNPDGKPLMVDVTGQTPDGTSIDLNQIRVSAAGVTQVNVPAASALRLRACESLGTGGTRAPVTWDFAVASPATLTTCTFGSESVIVGARQESGPRQVQLQRLDGSASQSPSFTLVQASDLGFSPDRVFLHPSGGYAYTVQDRGSNIAELSAFRIDATTRELELVTTEFGQEAPNPVQFVYSTGLSESQLDFVIDPLGRFAYLLDTDEANVRTDIQVFRIEENGTLRATATVPRRIVTSLAFRPNGSHVYLYEDFNALDSQRDGFVRAFQIDPGTGALVLQSGLVKGECYHVGRPALAVHPSSRFAYLAVGSQEQVRVAAFSIGDNGTLSEVDRECSEFKSIRRFTFDPTGRFLYATGTIAGDLERVVRYEIDLTTGALVGSFSEQDVGTDLDRITAGANPALPTDDKFKNIVYVTVGDTLIPHSRDANGVLTPVPGGVSLPFGSSPSTRLVTQTRSGTVQIQRAR